MIPGFPLVNHVAFPNMFCLPTYFKVFCPSKSVFIAHMIRSSNCLPTAPATFFPFPKNEHRYLLLSTAHLFMRKPGWKNIYVFQIPFTSLKSLSLLQIMTSLVCLFENLNLAESQNREMLFSATSLSLGHSWPGLHIQDNTTVKVCTFFYVLLDGCSVGLQHHCLMTRFKHSTSQYCQCFPFPAHCTPYSAPSSWVNAQL